MSEMIERVAQAIAEAEGLTWESLPNTDADAEKMYENVYSTRDDFRHMARSAIAAMREATVPMLSAGMGTGFMENQDEGLATWRDMIDAALR